MFFKKKEKTRLERYQDPMGELSNRQLKVSAWYVKNKILLENILKIFLIVFSVVTLSFSLWKWGDYLIFGYTQDRQMAYDILDETPNYSAAQTLYRAQDLQIGRPEVFAGGVGKYDFVTDIFNPNERWVAQVYYKYTFSGGETDLTESFLLPGERRPIVFFGSEAGSFPTAAKLVIEDIKWTKIDPHTVADVEEYVTQRLDFVVENFDFISARASEGTDAHQISFDLTNQSVYSYWSPHFYVELLGGLDAGSRAGIIPLNISEFRAGDTEEIVLSSLAEQLNVVDIKIMPIINVFDRNEFMQPGD